MLKRVKTPTESAAPAPSTSARRLGLIVGGGVAALALLFLLTNTPQSAPTSSTRTAAAPVRKAAAPPAKAMVARELKDYSALMRRNLFTPLIKDEVRRGSNLPTPANTRMDPLLPAGVGGLTAQPRPAPKPAVINGWSYIGSVTVDGAPFALVQKSGSGDYGYYRIGESLEGLLIQEIRPEGLVLANAGGSTVTLTKTSGAPQPAANAQANNSGNAGSNSANAAPSGAPNAGTPAMTLPAANAASGERPSAAAMEQFRQMRRERREGRNRGGGESGGG